MFDPERFQLYDAERRLMLAVMPLTREEALAQIPGEFVVGDRLLAKRLGVEAVPEDVMNARFSEFAAKPEEKILRLWMNASENADSCDIFVSPFDALPDAGGAPDWSLKSCGFFLGDIAVFSEWIATIYGVETPEDLRRVTSRFLSRDLERMVRAVKLFDLAENKEIACWPILHDNPLRAFSAASESYPEIRYDDDDFDIHLKPEALGS